MATAPIFHVVPGSAVKSAIDGNRQKVFEAVEAAYRLHAAGESVNPNSCFLRYPDNPPARIIALPAHLGGVETVCRLDGVKNFLPVAVDCTLNGRAGNNVEDRSGWQALSPKLMRAP